MNIETAPTDHLTDGELVCHLDGELLTAEHERVLAHASQCSDCGGRLRTLQARSEAVSEWYARSPVPNYGDLRRARTRAAIAGARSSAARRSGPARWHLRAAASITILLAAAFTVEPVRAWIGERWEDLTAPARVESTEAVPAVAGAGREESPLIVFDPAGDEFVLELQHPQRQGTVTLRMADAGRASAQIVGSGAGGVLVLPNGIRIENESGSRAVYLLTLPEGTRLLRLRIGSGPEVTVPLDGPADTPLVLDLGSAPPR